MDSLIEEQYADLLLRFKRRRLPLTKAIQELVAISRRPAAINDAELREALDKIAEAHQAGTLNTYAKGTWKGAPTTNAIAGVVGKGKSNGRLLHVRNVYYTLCLGLPPYNADEPDAEGDQIA